jgi:hypothetical protein
VDPNGEELLSLIQCFPNLEELSISWSIISSQQPPNYPLKPNDLQSNDLPRALRRLQLLPHRSFYWDADEVDVISKSIEELQHLSNHLPLNHIKDFGIFFQDFDITNSREEQAYVQQLSTVIQAMRLSALESFHFGFSSDVFDVPPVALVVSPKSRSCSLFADDMHPRNYWSR